MEKQQINRQEITHSLYSAGFISCLIKRLLEAYEAYDYKLADLRKIGIDSYAITALPRDNQIWRRSVEVKKLNDEDLITLGLDPKKLYNQDTVFLPSSDMIEKYSFLTNGINIETLKRYPYIQEFIDYLNDKHKIADSEEVFVTSMRTYLDEYLKDKKYEINHYVQEHYLVKEESCKVNRATLFNTLKYLLEKFEKSVECCDKVQAIYDTEGDCEAVELLHNFVIFSMYGQYELQSYIGKTVGKDIDIKGFYKKSEMDLEFYLNNLVLQGTKVFEHFIVFRYFAYRLYELTREKDYINTTDIEVILADIANEYKRARKRNPN